MENNNVIRLTEEQLKDIINESVQQILEEGFMDNMKSAWNGAKMAYKGQQMKDRGVENFKQNWGRDDLAAQANPWASKPENTASMQANEAFKLYKQYQAEANKYLTLYRQLSKKYDLEKTGVGQVKSKESNPLYGKGGIKMNKNKFGSRVAGRDRTRDTQPTGLYGKN